MKYSLFDEYFYNCQDIKFSRSELDIIQDIFNIPAGGKRDANDYCILKYFNNSKGEFFKVHSDGLGYVSENVNFSYITGSKSKSGHLVIKNNDGIYYILIDNEKLSIKYYDSLAFSCLKERYDDVYVDYNAINLFKTMGIFPDNEYEQKIDLSVLNHFKIVKLLMTMDDVFYKLFNGDNIDNLLDKQESELVIKKIRWGY